MKEFDVDPTTFSQGANSQAQGQRRMSYPTMPPFRPMPPSQLLYQQQQMQPQGVAYVPQAYTAPVMYSYNQGRGAPQQPYGGLGQQYYSPSQQ